MRLKPLWDHVVVRKVEEGERRGIVLLRGIAAENHAYGEVVAVGPGTRFADGRILEPSVAVGDVVLFRKISGEALMMDAETFVLLREGDVIGILGAAPLVLAVAVGR